MGADGGSVGFQPKAGGFGEGAEALRRLGGDRQVVRRIKAQGGKGRRLRAFAPAVRRFGIGGGAEAFPDQGRLEPEGGAKGFRRRVSQAFQQRQSVEALLRYAVSGEPFGESAKRCPSAGSSSASQERSA